LEQERKKGTDIEKCIEKRKKHLKVSTEQAKTAFSFNAYAHDIDEDGVCE
jgi:hypothetical protein